MSFQKNMKELIVASLVIALSVVLCMSYAKHYNERTQNYDKHMYVLQHECRSGRQLATIQYNKMTYDGTSTNCTEAVVFTSIPPCLGAIHDMWITSPFFALMYATDWKIQALYLVLAVVAVVTSIQSYFKHQSHREVLETFKSNQRNTAKSFVDGRERMLVPAVKKKPEPHANIIQEVLEKGPTLIRSSRNDAIARVNFSSQRV